MKKVVLLIASLYLMLSGYSQPGTLDLSFAERGWGTTDFANFTCIAAQADSKMVVAGIVANGFGVARYNPDGSLDKSFDADGKVLTSFDGGESPNALAIQNDGKIIVAGAPALPAQYTVMARYNADGSLDGSFLSGGKGIVSVGFGAFSIALQKDGKIMLGGTFQGGVNGTSFSAARLNNDGSLDKSFNGTGITVTSLGADAEGRSVIVQPDGKILLAGGVYPKGPAVVRYNPDGSLDNSFNGNGMVVIDTREGTAYSYGLSAAIQKDGKIVVGGVHFGNTTSNPSFEDFYITRVLPNGSLDSAFGQNGKTITDLGGFDMCNAVAISESGKIVAIGGIIAKTEVLIGLARYKADGSQDMSFGNNGLASINLGSIGEAVAIDNNRVYVAGGAQSAATNKLGAIAAYISGDLEAFIGCPPGAVVNTDPGKCAATVYNLDPVVSGNTAVKFTLSGATTGSGIGSVSGKTFEKGGTKVTYALLSDTIKTCSFSVTVNDQEPPSGSCPASITVDYNPSGYYIIPPLTVSDNCGIGDITYIILGATTGGGAGRDASGMLNPGINLITWNIPYSSNLLTFCRMTVVVNPPPVITKLSLKVSPNPSSSFFNVTVNSTNAKQPVIITISNLFGRVLETKTAFAGQTIRIGASYQPGIYFLEAVQDKQKESKLLIKF